MNPYEVLGVRRNASPETVKRAFRAWAKRAHPDAGGNADEFRRVHAAWRVLSDPERRRRYDMTGEIDEPGADTATALVLSVVAWSFNAALEHFGKQQANIVQQDMIATMRTTIEQRQARASEQITHLNANARILKTLLGRFERSDDDPNLMEELVAARTSELERAAAGLEADRKLCQAALDMLAEYRFRREAVTQIMTMVATGSTTTSNRTTGYFRFGS